MFVYQRSNLRRRRSDVLVAAATESPFDIIIDDSDEDDIHRNRLSLAEQEEQGRNLRILKHNDYPFCAETKVEFLSLSWSFE